MISTHYSTDLCGYNTSYYDSFRLWQIYFVHKGWTGLRGEVQQLMGTEEWVLKAAMFGLFKRFIAKPSFFGNTASLHAVRAE